MDHVVKPFQRFARLDSAGGLLLLAFTALAMIWANTPYARSYIEVFHETKLSIGFGSAVFAKDLVHWINDALMAVFFLLVGLEIKRELLVGELASMKRAALPIAGAVGGMLVPAAIYAGINWARPTIHGWGVPMATDIAFALGVLALAGRRAPLSLRVFLTSLAIVDDIGALAVIAIFYTENLAVQYLIYALSAIVVLITLNAMRVRWVLPYIIVGVVLWYFVFNSGVHATIAGVLLAFTIPAHARVQPAMYVRASRDALDVFERTGQTELDVKANPTPRAAVQAIGENCRLVLPPLHRMEQSLVPWVAFAILPLFALANAGVHIGEDITSRALEHVTLGVAAGLVLGKPIGILAVSWLAVKLNLAALPSGVTWRHIVGAGFLGGIGFTMALFIANLAFPSLDDLDSAKIGILGASFVSGLIGLAVLARAGTGDASPPTGHE